VPPHAGARHGGHAGRAVRWLRRGGGAALGVVSVFAVAAAGWPASGQTLARQPVGGQPVAGPAAPGEPHHVQMMSHAVVGLVPVPPVSGHQAQPGVAPLRHLLHADLMVVAPTALPGSVTAAIRRLPGVRAAVPVDAAKVAVNGKFVAVLGVDPSRFRAFADKPTASDTALWRGVAGGNVAVSYTMGRLDKLPPGSFVTVDGHQQQNLVVGGVGTVGIAGVDAVVSDSVARSLGFPAHNAIVVSAGTSHLRTRKALRSLKARIEAAVPHGAAVQALVVPGVTARAGDAVTTAAATGGLLSPAQVTTMLRAAVSRVGMPYVWGAEGPRSFDCSGLVKWSFAQAGLVMPRVAADQARTGPAVPVRRLQPGDLLFYHTDPTAPTYISHVAIYLGNGRMIQAPEPGLDVEVVPVDLGSDYAGAVAVSPRVAAAVAATAVG
jgi:peptidoglycan DL-endopeptidase CwlO